MLFSGNLHILFLPDSMDSLVVDLPAFGHQFSMHSGTTEAGPPLGDPTHLFEQTPLIGTLTGTVALSAPRLPQYSAGPTLGHPLWPQTATHLFHGASSTLGAYQFPWEASLRISISRACSATIFFSRAFSFNLRGLTMLKRLNLTSTQVTAEGVKGLQAALPKCEIVRKRNRRNLPGCGRLVRPSENVGVDHHRPNIFVAQHSQRPLEPDVHPLDAWL